MGEHGLDHGWDSTEARRLGLQGALCVGTHTRCTTHVHTEDSKSLPSPSIRRSVGAEHALCGWMGAEARRLLSSMSSSGEGT